MVTLHFHVVGVAAGISAGRAVILEHQRIGVDHHRGGHGLTGRILAVGVDVAGVHVGEVGGDGGTALNAHGLAAVLGHIVAVGVGRAFAGVVVAPEEDDVHLLGGGRNGIVPVSSALVVTSAGVQGHVGDDEQGLGLVRGVGPVGERGRCGRSGRSVLHIRLTDGVDVIVLVGKHQTGLVPVFGNVRIVFRVMAGGIGKHHGRGIAQCAAHRALGGGHRQAGVTHKTDGRIRYAGFGNAAQHGRQIAGLAVYVAAENGSVKSLTGGRHGRRGQDAYDHHRHQQCAEDSLQIVCEFHHRISLFFVFGWKERWISSCGLLTTPEGAAMSPPIACVLVSVAH